MLSQIPASMLWEWIAFSKIEPFAEERADLRAAIVAQQIANANRRKGQAAYKTEQFMPKFGNDRRQGWRDQLKMVEMLNQAFGGSDERTDEQKGWRDH